MITVLDATLREGEQTAGVYFSPHIKLAIADLLDRIGIDVIEAGHPAVSASIRLSVEQLAARGYSASVGAHSRSLRSDVDLALACGVSFLGIFYCVSDERARGVFGKSVAEAVDQIAEVIAYAKSKAPNLLVRYTPEDTVRSSFENVVQASIAAANAGADIISVADTTGYMVPHQRGMYDFVLRLRERLAKSEVTPRIAVHCHNDRGFALANALDAFRAGAEIIDATVMGLGERAGIVDLAQLLVTLAADFEIKNQWNLALLPELYELVSKHAKIPIPANAPIVGANAFTHCAGVHTHAAAKNPLHYESLSPELVGRTRTFALDHMSGLASVQYGLEQLGIESEREFSETVLQRVKTVGETGRTVDLAELRQIVEWCRHSPPAG